MVQESKIETAVKNNIVETDGGSSMPGEASRQVVLEFLADHKIGMPPSVIFRGLKTERGIDFESRTTKTILQELEEQGLVNRVKKEALDNGNIEPIVSDDDGIRAYYIISQKGLEQGTNPNSGNSGV